MTEIPAATAPAMTIDTTTPAPKPATLPVIRIQAGRHKRAQHGHPWVYSNEVDMDKAAKALPAGSIVRVTDAGG
ncbi:MAG: hypothetical protein ACOVN0_10550, partial [Niveispirillum sp.]